MALGTSILKSIIQAANTRDSSRAGPWRTEVTAIGTTDGLKIIKRHLFIGHISRQYNLGAYLNIFCLEGSSNLGADLVATEHQNIIGFLRTQRRGISNIRGVLCSWGPSVKNLTADIRSYVGINLQALLEITQPSDILAHLTTVPHKNLLAAIRKSTSGWSNLGTVLRGYGPSSAYNIGAELATIEHQNIIGFLRTQRKGISNIRGVLCSWGPSVKNLTAVIQSYVETNLQAFLETTQPSDILAHLTTVPHKNLLAVLRVITQSASDLRARLHGKIECTPFNMGASLVVIEYQNVIGALRAKRKGINNVRGILRGWWHDEPPEGDLLAVIQPYVELDFPALLEITQPINLLAYLKVWPYKNLHANIQGYAILDLLARIKTFTENISNLSAGMAGYYPVDLMSIIQAKGSGYYYLNAYLRVLQPPVNLSAQMKYIYKDYSNLGAAVKILPMYLLKASITGWAERGLSAYISTVLPPGCLRAVIVQHGTYRNLISSVVGFLGVTKSKNLVSVLFGWAYLDIRASITTIDHISLMSSITSKGGTKDLSVHIKVREIIFNELYKFSTINTANLRAYVGFSLCSLRTPVSAYISLIAAIVSVPIYNLGATIEGIKTIFSGFKDLGVFVGYTNKYSIMSKFLSFKYSMSVSEAIRINPAFFKDSLSITFKIIKGQQDLRTYITPEPHNAFLGATIYSRLLIIHGSGTNKVLTEELVEIENYRRIWSEFIDVYLHTEKPIYYSGGKVFAQNYGDPIFSFSFERISSMGINYSYNLTHDVFFDSTDAAIRYGFSKITGRTAFTVLGATIESNVKHLKLNAKIEGKEKIPLYIDSPLTYLKYGTVSFMGTCINNMLYKSKLNVFGGMQDITSNISAVPN